jgi:phosphoribosylaminoimidazole-succinocarboxamide synthase
MKFNYKGADSPATEIDEGKTKRVWQLDRHPIIGAFYAKDILTAGDGKRMEVAAGKGDVVTQITCDTFDFLMAKGVPLAYRGPCQDHSNVFFAELCRMIQLEIVGRAIATGSYLERHPEVKPGTVFDKPIFELFLKTKEENWGGYELECDGPLIIFADNGTATLHHPHKKFSAFDTISGVVPKDKVAKIFPGFERNLKEDLEKVTSLADQTFSLVAKAWNSTGCTWKDGKMECGINPRGEIVIADTIGPEEIRMDDPDGHDLSKQMFRNGTSAEETVEWFTRASQFSKRFVDFI